MRRYLLIGLSSVLVLVSGCSPWRTEELDARLESAENNAATARLRADQVCYRIDLVEQTANQALRIATQTQEEVRRLQQAKQK
ncbi:Lpp/OprI family alanine-zipper lipoprotein [Pseudomonas guariconensis]|uniref:Lpp/OprI family alanine-zipper lipoprotein n=1 Tax=Pseudomonas guariconensis TaxID=1288410 RepID=UPI002B059B1E|nr:Lpp/OprI family alanine-zipper lipoprotein [Pseudomonas guariconensis]